MLRRSEYAGSGYEEVLVEPTRTWKPEARRLETRSQLCRRLGWTDAAFTYATSLPNFPTHAHRPAALSAVNKIVFRQELIQVWDAAAIDAWHRDFVEKMKAFHFAQTA
jgi:hypothetical protein